MSLIATRKNRQLRIPEEKKGVYASLGYTIKDENGQTLSEPENPQKEIAELKAENAELKAELDAMKKADGAEKKTAAPAKKTAAKKAAAKETEESVATNA